MAVMGGVVLGRVSECCVGECVSRGDGGWMGRWADKLMDVE